MGEIFRDDPIGFLLTPGDWPVVARRIFVLTIPVSGPIWLAMVTAIWLLCAVCMLTLMPLGYAIEWATEMWRSAKATDTQP